MKALIWSEIKQRIYFSETFGTQQVIEKRRVNSLAEFPTSGYKFSTAPKCNKFRSYIVGETAPACCS